MSDHGKSEPKPMPADAKLTDGFTCPTNVSFATDIAPLFLINPDSVQHMIDYSKQNKLNPPIDLTNYADVKHYVSPIYSQVKGGSMPIGGPAWTSDQVNLLLCWYQQGCPP
jgi:hypothetical protein